MQKNVSYKQSSNKGFSLVELMVIVAVMIVLLAILVPSLLKYVENSRIQKDESAMDEVCHGILLALSDSEIFDEAVSYSIPNNYVTYTDSSGVYAAKYIDEEFWAPDGSGEAVTITFNPDENGTYNIAEGLVNDMTYGNGSVADSRTADGVKQCYFSEMGQQKLYHKVAQTVGETFSEKSATYQNSSYTVFITFDVVNGIKRADVYGEFNGTNLSPDSPASLGSGTSSYTEEEEPEQTKTGGTTQSNFTNSDLTGSGGVINNGELPPTYRKDILPCGHKETDTGDHHQLPCNHYACRCDCEPAACGIDGHTTGDGKDHTLADCGHYKCVCICFVVPEGGLYTSNNGTVYNPGEIVKDIFVGDIYRYGDYEYCYGKYRSSYSWTTSYGAALRDGWGVRALSKTKTEYGEILTTIRNKNVIDMSCCFEDCTKMTTAPAIPATVDRLSNTFDGCSNLTTVGKLPDGITGLYQTFYCCTKLENVPELPDSITSLNFTFFGCRSLKTLTLPSNVKSLYQTFYYCTAMTEAPAIPETVTDMRAAFTMSGLVHAPKLPSNLKCLAATFSSCTSLVDAPVIPASVTEMGNAFSNCTALQGNIEINAESASYANLFRELDFSQQNMVLTGSSPHLDEMGLTGWCYCTECNSGCKNPTQHKKSPVTFATTHGGYQKGHTQVFGKWDFRGAQSVDITLTYQTHYNDSITIYTKTTPLLYLHKDGSLAEYNRQTASFYSNSPSPRKETLTFEGVPLHQGVVKFSAASSNTSYWGFEITITPNYCDLPRCTGGTATCFERARCQSCNKEYGSTLSHTGGTATCFQKAICDLCHTEYGEILSHTGGTATCMQKAVCDLCHTEYGSLVAHTGGTATCSALARCSTCGQTYGGYGPHSMAGGACSICGSQTTVIESEHSPYSNNLNNVVLGTWDYSDAKSVTITITYQTESTSYDYIYLKTGSQYITPSGTLSSSASKFGGTTKTTKTFTVNALTGSVIFKTDSSVNSYYGVTVTISPNY